MAAGDTTITMIGNLVDDPELRFTPSLETYLRSSKTAEAASTSSMFGADVVCHSKLIKKAKASTQL